MLTPCLFGPGKLAPVRIRMIPLAALIAVCAAAALAGPAGAASRPARIVGGAAAPAGTAPWTAALVAHNLSAQDGAYCGATVASPTAVITAAHCVLDGPGQFDVVTGRSVLSATDGQRLPVTSVDLDPAYSRDRTGHDAAVVHLGSPTEAPAIGIATAETAGLAAPGVRLLLTGWGIVTNRDKVASNALREATVAVQGNRKCRTSYRQAFNGAQMICSAGGLPDACHGDSGGPLVSLDGAAPTLVGIVSFGGQHCGDAAFPGVYTRVSYESAFLQRAISKTPAPPPATGPVAPGSQIGTSYGPLG
jgi:secreted trypsin-like serine protease